MKKLVVVCLIVSSVFCFSFTSIKSVHAFVVHASRENAIEMNHYWHQLTPELQNAAINEIFHRIVVSIFYDLVENKQINLDDLPDPEKDEKATSEMMEKCHNAAINALTIDYFSGWEYFFFYIDKEEEPMEYLPFIDKIKVTRAIYRTLKSYTDK